MLGAIILAALSCPASSIVVIPKLAWWSVTDLPSPFYLDLAFLRGMGNMSSCLHHNCAFVRLVPTNASSYIAAIGNSSEIWPEYLTVAYLPAESCLSSISVENVSCPAGGYSLLAQAGSIQQNPARSSSQWNVTFRDDNVARFVAAESNQGSWSVSSSVSQVTAKLLWQVWSVLDHQTEADRPQLRTQAAKGSELLKPLVQVECMFAGNGSTPRAPRISSQLLPAATTPRSWRNKVEA